MNFGRKHSVLEHFSKKACFLECWGDVFGGFTLINVRNPGHVACKKFKKERQHVLKQ